MMNGFGTHGWGMGLWWIIGVVIVLFTIWVVLKGMNQSRFNHGLGKSALDILKDRYARGEISKAEFASLKKEIE